MKMIGKTKSMVNKKVPVLITWDVDPDRWATYEDRKRALSTAMNLCEEFEIRSTYFITANFAHEYPKLIDRMQMLGQEVGCHGLTHTDEEDYNRMPADMQRKYIEEATQKLETVVGTPIQTFRSPRVKTSAVTLKLLAEYGYVADSSVCSQRIDFVSSNLINPGWFTAPRRPYHPNRTNAFKRGDLPIWEIPVSAAILPFISGSLNVFGVRFMKALFRLLYKESEYTGKPIVYLAHPPELINKTKTGKQSPHLLTQKLSLSQIKTHGFLIRRALYRMDGQAWCQATRQLFAYMASFSDVVFMSGKEYVDYLNKTVAKGES